MEHPDQAGDRPLILTGANAAFARTLWQFLRSAERRRHVAGYDWIAYDLGMTGAQRRELERRFAWCSFRSFDFAAHPPHLRVERGTYAWKPAIIHEAARDRRGPVMWLDSATILRDGLTEPLEIIRRNGLVTLSGRTAIGENADHRMFAAIGFPLELWHVRERVGGVFGFDTRHAVARDLVRRWYEVALDEAVIAPPGAPQAHNYDQALLSCLLITEAAAGRLSLEPSFDVDISLPRPMRWLTTRNKVDPRLPTWADPLARAWYWTYKTVDQALLRWHGWLDRWPDGLRRVFKENFTVHLVDARTGRRRALDGPRLGYWADPFVHDAGDRRWLFVEEYMASQDRGRLVALEVFSDLSVGPVSVVADAPTHRSFPFLFTIDGVLHMIPESGDELTLDIWRCERLPDRWRRVRRLFWGIAAVDTVVVRRDGRWWLITSVQDPAGGNPSLEIHSTDDLLQGRLQPHPINATHLYRDAANGTGRNAGPVVEHEGRLLRMVQWSSGHYGEGSRVMEIVELDETHYREEPFTGAHPLAEIVASHSPHHVSRHGSLTAFDVRDRARDWP